MMNLREFDKDTKIREFDSIGEMTKFLSNTPVNGYYGDPSSQDITPFGKNFAMSNNYKEALDLLLFGWSEAADKMTKKLSILPKPQPATRQRSVYSVAGHTASVPRYLQGIPTNMVSSVPDCRKQPVVVINRTISYAAFWKAEDMLAEGIKALQVVQAIEASGRRVKLNICWIVSDRGQKRGFKVTIKQPGERLNISKMAFPLAHPSMLRRIGFKYLETEPDMPFRFIGYGRPCSECLKELYPNEFFIRETVDIENFLKNF